MNTTTQETNTNENLLYENEITLLGICIPIILLIFILSIAHVYGMIYGDQDNVDNLSYIGKKFLKFYKYFYQNNSVYVIENINVYDYNYDYNHNSNYVNIINNNETELECVICMETVGYQKAVLNCGHAFHVECINRWIIGEQKNSCPVCRRRIFNMASIINL